MKRIWYFFLCFFLWLLLSPTTQAQWDELTRKDAFIFFAALQKEVPASFQYISLGYKDVAANSELEDALQKLVYLDLVKNTSEYIRSQKTLSLKEFQALSEAILKIQIKQKISDSSVLANIEDLKEIQALYSAQKESPKNVIHIWGNLDTGSASDTLGKKEKILLDVYETLMDSHYDRETLTQDQLVEGAISWLAAGTDDTYTTYFPPVESKDFFQALEGEYEGIGAYVEMPSPWLMLIVSPIVGSPSEAVWLRGGDIITHVDDKEITKENSLKEVISWIKGLAGSKVKLTIQREWEKNPLSFEVTRAKILLKDVEYKKLNTSTFYIQLKNFGDHVDSDFEQALTTLKADTKVKKVIIDVRNNPGGYLDKVSNILSYFVPKGDSTAIVSHGQKDTPYLSRGYDLIDISQYEIILLQNGGSASASEILVGTLKDYFPEATIIGEQSFGKGSVQSLKTYYDGSTLKFTSAKWFTGKTRKGIDKVGITPDVLLPFDAEAFKKSKKDNQLEKALLY